MKEEKEWKRPNGRKETESFHSQWCHSKKKNDDERSQPWGSFDFMEDKIAPIWRSSSLLMIRWNDVEETRNQRRIRDSFSQRPEWKKRNQKLTFRSTDQKDMSRAWCLSQTNCSIPDTVPSLSCLIPSQWLLIPFLFSRLPPLFWLHGSLSRGKLDLSLHESNRETIISLSSCSSKVYSSSIKVFRGETVISSRLPLFSRPRFGWSFLEGERLRLFCLTQRFPVFTSWKVVPFLA